ncbi:MAG: hypothetical protein ACRERS_00475 [Methylococcales bacterium]
MKDPGGQILLWHFAICCLPLLLIYLGIFGTAWVIGWLTSWAFLIIAGLVLLGLIFFPGNRSRGNRAKQGNEK